MESQPQNPEFRNNPENFHQVNMCTNETTKHKKNFEFHIVFYN